jgi:hypothetical protein
MLTAGVSSAGGVGAFVLAKFRGKTRVNVARQPAAVLGSEAEPGSASFGEWIAAVCAHQQESQH